MEWRSGAERPGSAGNSARGVDPNRPRPILAALPTSPSVGRLCWDGGGGAGLRLERACAVAALGKQQETPLTSTCTRSPRGHRLHPPSARSCPFRRATPMPRALQRSSFHPALLRPLPPCSPVLSLPSCPRRLVPRSTLGSLPWPPRPSRRPCCHRPTFGRWRCDAPRGRWKEKRRVRRTLSPRTVRLFPTSAPSRSCTSTTAPRRWRSARPTSPPLPFR